MAKPETDAERAHRIRTLHLVNHGVIDSTDKPTEKESVELFKQWADNQPRKGAGGKMKESVNEERAKRAAEEVTA
jgi:hypothetical protein